MVVIQQDDSLAHKQLEIIETINTSNTAMLLPMQLTVVCSIHTVCHIIAFWPVFNIFSA